MARISDEEWFVRGTRRSGTNSKRRLLEKGILDNKCYSCGITNWNNKDIVLHLEHMDGDHLNNEIANLTLLCYNCHSQTDTFSGRNVKNKRTRKYCSSCNIELHKKTKRDVCADCHLAISIERTKEQRIKWDEVGYTKEDFISAWKTSKTYSEVKIKLGYKATNGRLATTIRNEAYFMGLSFEHMDNYRSGSRGKKEYTEDELKVYLSTYNKRMSGNYKERVRQSGILGNTCQNCGIGYKYNGKFLQLQIDHIDGDNTSNNVENLRLLCPNCHSQTHNWGSRNLSIEYKGKLVKVHDLSDEQRKELHKRRLKPNRCVDCDTHILKGSTRCNSCSSKMRYKELRGGIDIPSEEDLMQVLRECNCNFTKVGRYYKVSDNNIRKWCKRYGIPHKVKDLRKFIERLDIAD